MLDVDLVRLDPGLPVPAPAHPGDAGVDLAATEDVTLAPGHRALVGTGVAIGLPQGYAAFVHPRSGLAVREGLGMVNAPGTIDAGYRGEIRVCLVNHDLDRTIVVRRGDRVAQLVVQRIETPRFRELPTLDDLAPSTRGEGGFGSTGTAGPGYGAATTGDTGPEEHDATERSTEHEGTPAHRAGRESGRIAW